jgi:hypothetical protein
MPLRMEETALAVEVRCLFLDEENALERVEGRETGAMLCALYGAEQLILTSGADTKRHIRRSAKTLG